MYVSQLSECSGTPKGASVAYRILLHRQYESDQFLAGSGHLHIVSKSDLRSVGQLTHPPVPHIITVERGARKIPQGK